MGSLEIVLAQAADNLYPARMQMAISLGWHIVFSCLGVAFPAMVMFAEWRGHRTGDAALHELAHTWAKAMGVLSPPARCPARCSPSRWAFCGPA